MMRRADRATVARLARPPLPGENTFPRGFEGLACPVHESEAAS